MYRYHRKIYFPHIDKLRELNNKLNIKAWKYSVHALENVKYRIADIENMLNFIKNITLEENQIFEYYKLYNNIEKLCYRIAYDNTFDIVLVLSNDKSIITIYLNNKDDNHDTLKKELYQSIS